jgi:hypothetical protein
MGFNYLENKRWSQVTRDERFFCQHLFQLVRSESAEVFADYISQFLSLGLSNDGEWEIGFEVCFYRDLWHLKGRKGELYSPKRTFDLCLFGEKDIVIIEAKAATGFDQSQNAIFAHDVDKVQELTRVDNVLLVGLCSSIYPIETEVIGVFNNKILRWKDLAARYGGDEILTRADKVYENQDSFSSFGLNSDNRLSGSALVKAFHEGNELWVGRGGGFNGERLREDIRTGRWKTHIYEVNTTSTEPPSSNYFRLKEFVQAVAPEAVGKDYTE